MSYLSIGPEKLAKFFRGYFLARLVDIIEISQTSALRDDCNLEETYLWPAKSECTVIARMSE